MTKRWIRFGALAAASLGLSACVATGGGPSSGQKSDGPFLYQNRGVAHAPAVKQVDAASYNAVLGDRYWPQPGEFFFFKQVGVERGAAPTEDFGAPDQAYAPPPGAPGGYQGYQQSSFAPQYAPAPQYGQPAGWAGQTAAR